MRNSAIFALATAAVLPAVSATLAARQSGSEDSNTEYVNEVCSPEVEGNGPVPPCVQIGVIEGLCQPNGTESIDYEAHAQCMCNGSYFSDWRGCQNCLLVHGFRSERDNAYWERVMSAASDALCTGTPTAVLQSLFASAQNNTGIPFATTGNSRTSDQFPDETAVSLYYTPTVTQGPGRITGDAASATADETETPTTDAPQSTTTEEGDDDDETSTTTAGETESTTEPEDEATSSSPNAAVPTQKSGIVMALAGAAMLAAL